MNFQHFQSELTQDITETASTSSYSPSNPKKKDTNNEQVKKLLLLIENQDSDELNYFIGNENISKSALQKGLCYALQYYRSSRLDIIEILLNNGADPNGHFHYINKSPNQKIEEKDKVTILMYACQKGDLLLTDKLLHYEHNINLTDIQGKNALFYTIMGGDNVDVIAKLIEYHIDVNCKGNVNGNGNSYVRHTPLTLAAECNLTKTFKNLLENGGEPNYVTEPNKENVLHIAVRNCNEDIVRSILKDGRISLEKKNKDGKTALEMAIEQNKGDIAEVIKCKIKEIDNITKDNVNQLLLGKEDRKGKKKKNVVMNGNSNVNVNTNSNVSKGKQQQRGEKNMNNQNDNNNNKTNVLSSNTTTAFTNTKHNNIKRIIQNYYKHNNVFFNHHNNGTNTTNMNKQFLLEIPFHLDLPFRKTKPTVSSLLNISPINNEATLSIEVSESEIDLQSKLTSYETELSLKNDLIASQEQTIQQLTSEKEQLLQLKTKNESTITEQTSIIKALTDQITTLKTELNDITTKYNSLLHEQQQQQQQRPSNQQQQQQPTSLNMNDPLTYTQYLNKKYINFKYDETYIISSLSKDLNDYQKFVNERISHNENVYQHLINNLQEAVNESLQEYEVCLYGSHATNLCLPWSDLDVVLVPKVNNTTNTNKYNHAVCLSQLHEHLKKQRWIKESKFIRSATIPIIKLTTIDEYNSMPIDISIQDERHFGLKCVDLVKKYITQYECLKPLVLALKNVLKQANLNDPYKGGISSYGLILMIVFFLQKQQKLNKDISISNSNLGRLFYEFIQFYGLQFEPSKYIIYIKSNINDDKEFFNYQVSIIYIYMYMYLYIAFTNWK